MADCRYRAPPAADLACVALDGLTALYHRPSGITHLLAAPAPEILEALAPAPLSAAALLARLRADFDLADGGEPALVARLDELVEAGLLARA